MKVVCSWCQAIISDDKSDDEEVSHGACIPCYKKEMKKIDAWQKDRAKKEKVK